MATIKKRIYISVSDEIDKALETLARKENIPKATKATQMVERALELHEDVILSAMADERINSDAKYVALDDI